MTQVRKIVVGYAYSLRVRLPEGTVWFPSGSTWRSQIRAFRGSPTALAELTTANGGLVRVSDREMDILMTTSTTAAFTEERVVLDWARTDTSPPEYFGYVLTLPVMVPVTENVA